MQKLFNRILVPVDFSDNSKRVVEKAIELANQYDCSIHLLHVVEGLAVPLDERVKNSTPVTDASQAKQAIETQFCLLIQACSANTGIAPDNIRYSVEAGNWNDNLIQFANRYKIDLVLAGQQGALSPWQNKGLNTDQIATKTNVPVITVPCNRTINRYSSIMIPITDFLPVKKLMYGVYIALKNNTSIRLLGIENASTKDKMMHYLEKAYRLISDNCNVKVELEKTESADVNEALKKYAHSKHTDLVILDPGSQQKTTGFFSTLLGSLMEKYAAPPVLTISAG